MRCKNCINEFQTTTKTRNKKYCDSCKLIIWRIQKRDWKRKKRVNGNCLECGVNLKGLKLDRLRCNYCRDERIKKEKRELHRKVILNKYKKIPEKTACIICGESFFSVKGVRIHHKIMHSNKLINLN